MEVQIRRDLRLAARARPFAVRSGAVPGYSFMPSPSDALARVPYVAASLERANTNSAAPSDASVERRRRPTDDDDDDDDARARLLACVRTAARVAEAVTRNALMRARV